MKHRRGRALRRRYGHFGMADIHKGTADLRKLASDNPLVTAAAVGAAGGALTAGMTTGSAALIGAMAGIAVEEAVKK